MARDHYNYRVGQQNYIFLIEYLDATISRQTGMVFTKMFGKLIR